MQILESYEYEKCSFDVKNKYMYWAFLSPTACLGGMRKGERTEQYRLGEDDLIVDENGDSFISVEDYVVAMINVLEPKQFYYECFTVAY